MAGVHQPVPEEASTDRASERANNLIVQNTEKRPQHPGCERGAQTGKGLPA